MTPEDTERRMTVARAALAEIGGDPGRIYRTRRVAACLVGDDEAYRALCIGAMAAYGPDRMVRCLSCSPVDLGRPVCTPVRDVLAGHTCQHERITT